MHIDGTRSHGPLGRQQAHARSAKPTRMALLGIYAAVLVFGPHDPSWMMLVVMSGLGTWLLCAETCE